MAKLDASTGRWVVSDDGRPDEGLGPRRGVAPELVRPAVGAARAEPPRPSGRRPRRRDRPVAAPARRRVTRGRADAPSTISSGSRPARPPPARSSASGSTRIPARPARRVHAATCAASRRSPGSLLEAAGPLAAAVKPNLAFFEAFGSAGIAALERLRAAVPAGLPVVIDAKRGDIGSTAARQAVALYDGLGADAITVSPYLGEEAIAPLIARADRFAYVLCRTSNPGAGELQGLVVAADATRSARRPSRSRRASRGASRRWGPGRDRRPRRRRDRAGRAAPRSGVWRPASRSSSPASAPRAATWPRSSPTARRPASRPAAGRAAGSSSTSRAGSPGRPRAGPARPAAADPGEAIAAAARDWAARLPVLP